MKIIFSDKLKTYIKESKAAGVALTAYEEYCWTGAHTTIDTRVVSESVANSLGKKYEIYETEDGMKLFLSKNLQIDSGIVRGYLNKFLWFKSFNVYGVSPKTQCSIAR